MALYLTSTSDLVSVITDATSDIECHASWVDNASGTITVGRTNTASIVTATTTTVVGSPASSTQRNVRHLNIRNNHASTSCNVDVNHTDGTNDQELIRATLLAGETLTLDATGQWHHYDVNGGEYAGFAAASQADMEAGTSTTTVVTPGRQHFHPGMAKFVCMTTGTTTPASQTPPAYNLTSITDTGVGRLTVTIGNDFSSANWCCQCSGMGISTTLTAVANVQTFYVRTSTLAAGTVEINARDATATTNALADPAGYFVCGWGDL